MILEIIPKMKLKFPKHQIQHIRANKPTNFDQTFPSIIPNLNLSLLQQFTNLGEYFLQLNNKNINGELQYNFSNNS